MTPATVNIVWRGEDVVCSGHYRPAERPTADCPGEAAAFDVEVATLELQPEVEVEVTAELEQAACVAWEEELAERQVEDAARAAEWRAEG